MTSAWARAAGPAYSYASFHDFAAVSPRADGSASRSSAAVGFERRAVPSPSSTSRRSCRVSDCSEVSTWSSWTGVAVWVTAIVEPSPRSALPGEPGCRSTKKLPSRKIRGRILAVASLCSGSPCSSIAIVTTVLSVPSWASIRLTLPTSTPAIRTGESGRSPFEDVNTALTS